MIIQSHMSYSPHIYIQHKTLTATGSSPKLESRAKLVAVMWLWQLLLVAESPFQTFTLILSLFIQPLTLSLFSFLHFCWYWLFWVNYFNISIGTASIGLRLLVAELSVVHRTTFPYCLVTFQSTVKAPFTHQLDMSEDQVCLGSLAAFDEPTNKAYYMYHAQPIL